MGKRKFGDCDNGIPVESKMDYKIIEGDGVEIIYRNKKTSEYFDMFGTKLNLNEMEDNNDE